MLVVRVDVWVLVTGAVWSAVAAVHGAVQGVDPGVRVLLLGRPLQRSAYVQDLGVVPLPGLTLPQLPGLGLDPGEEDDGGPHDVKNLVFKLKCSLYNKINRVV